MIVIWHQTTDLGNIGNPVFFESGLVPVAIINTDSLSVAAPVDLKSLELTNLSRPLVNFSVGQAMLITAVNRNNTVGDILCHFERNLAKCFCILSSSGLIEIEYYLPHVGISVDPELGDSFEDFPTLDLEYNDSVLVDRVNLPSYDHGFFYLETYSWSQITYQLLRTYK